MTRRPAFSPRRGRIGWGVTGLLVAASLPAFGQIERGPPPQLDPPSGRVDAAQVAETDRRIDPAQVGAARSTTPPVQLTVERAEASPGAQVSRGGRTAQPPAPLSQPAEGRTGAVTAIAGHDRCAPGEARARSAWCSHVIETRAAEFVRPTLQLSPEQRLLVDQRLRAGLTQTPADLARTIGREADPNDPGAQAIASSAAAAATPVEADKEPASAAALPDAPAAIVQAMVNPSGR